MWFNDAYRGIPPWDIGHPQREFVRLAEEGLVKGDLIDIGCGTGEHTILFASRGHKALGVDAAPLAIQKARAKATMLGVDAEFEIADALELETLKRNFDTAIDCGLFHVFSDHGRDAYVKSLSAVVKPKGRYFLLCFSDEEPVNWGGPRRVTQAEIRQSFSKGWGVDFIRPAMYESFHHADGGRAWFSGMTRLGS